jgi:hypothetical protein
VQAKTVCCVVTWHDATICLPSTQKIMYIEHDHLFTFSRAVWFLLRYLHMRSAPWVCNYPNHNMQTVPEYAWGRMESLQNSQRAFYHNHSRLDAAILFLLACNADRQMCPTEKRKNSFVLFSWFKAENVFKCKTHVDSTRDRTSHSRPSC